MPVRGKWLPYLGRGLFAVGILAVPLPAALYLAEVGITVGVMALITAAVTCMEGGFLPESRDFSGRMFRTATWLSFGGIALVVIAACTEPLRILVAPALYGRGF